MIKILYIVSLLELLQQSCNGESGYSYPKPEVASIETSKFIYYFRPPLEEQKSTKEHIITTPTKKIYKYIFIQAPNFPQPPPIVPPAQKIEEKTLVYVLSKKEQKPIFLPTPVPTKQSAPEVYYINYSLQKNETQPIISTNETSNKSTEESVTPSNEYGAPKMPVVETKSSAKTDSLPPNTSYGVPVLPTRLYAGPFSP